MSDQPSKRTTIDLIIEKKVPFVCVFFVVFLITYAFLAWIDFLPEPVSSSPETEEIKVDINTEEETIENEEVSITEPEIIMVENILPEKIIFDSLDRTVSVLNPTSKTIEDLDHALLSGVVRHPDSATLEQLGSVFILGHSSYLPAVNNENYKAFNGIQNLKWGDTIRLQAGNKEYVYRVDKVFQAYATTASVPIAVGKQRLVLATCNSFGSVDDRYIVEADLLEVRAVS